MKQPSQITTPSPISKVAGCLIEIPGPTRSSSPQHLARARMQTRRISVSTYPSSRLNRLSRALISSELQRRRSSAANSLSKGGSGTGTRRPFTAGTVRLPSRSNRVDISLPRAADIVQSSAYQLDLTSGEFGEERQGQSLGSKAFRDRKGAGPVA